MKKEIRKLFAGGMMLALIFPFNFLENLPDFNEGTTQIINEVSVEANTGGNSANGGIIQRGDAKANVRVKTIIDGGEIEDINIEIETEGDESIEKETKIENGTIKTKIDVKVEGEQKTEVKNQKSENNPPAGGKNSSLQATINTIWSKVIGTLINNWKNAIKLFL